jgi:hypothetical protein
MTEGNEAAVRYLLGEMDEHERERLQEAYFADDALFARLLEAEDDLVDAYVRGRLSEARRLRFEQRFGQAPAHAGRLRFARALQRAAGVPAAAAPPRRRPLPAWTAAAAAVLACVLLAAWWASRPGRPAGTAAGPATPSPTLLGGGSPPPSAAAQPSAAPSAAATPRGNGSRPPLEAAVASLVLRAGAARSGGGAPEVALAADSRWLRLVVELEPDLHVPRGRYEVVVQNAAGAEVFRQGGLAAEGPAPSVAVRVPAAALAARDHVALLSAEQAGGGRQYLRGYSFRVTRSD